MQRAGPSPPPPATDERREQTPVLGAHGIAEDKGERPPHRLEVRADKRLEAVLHDL